MTALTNKVCYKFKILYLYRSKTEFKYAVVLVSKTKFKDPEDLKMKDHGTIEQS